MKQIKVIEKCYDGKITWHENCCKCKDAVKITEKELKEKLSLR